jgi:outer membrane protein X
MSIFALVFINLKYLSMKKLMLIAALMLVSIGVSAQKKQFAVGANLGVGVYNNSYTPFGIGPKFQFYFWKQWRGEASFNYWTKKNDTGFLDFNANVHYVFNVAKNVNVYPLAGLTVITTHSHPSSQDGKTFGGFNLGGGIECFVAPQVKLNFEIKYQHAENEETIKTYDPAGREVENKSYVYKANGPVFQAGIAYCF